MDTSNEFCGNSELFNVQLLWNSSYPHFTQCFQDTVLILTPCACAFLLSPIFLYHAYTISRPGIPRNGLHVAKQFVTSLMVVLSVTAAVKAIVDHNNRGETSTQADVVSPVIRAVTILYMMILMHIQRSRGLVTSALVLIFWLTELAVGVVPIYSRIMEDTYEEEVTEFVISVLDFAVVFLLIILSCFAEPINNKMKSSPETRASSLSQGFFFWVTPLMRRGYTRPLEQADVWPPNPEDTCGSVVPRLKKRWTESFVVKKREKVDSYGSDDFSGDYGDYSDYSDSQETSSLLGGATPPGEKTRDVSIFRTVVKAFGLELIGAQVLELLHNLGEFVHPLILQELILFIQSVSAPVWKGYFLGGAAFVFLIVQSVVGHQAFYRLHRVGIRIRTSLMASIYEKTLVISAKAKKGSSTGQVVNLVSVDAENILGFIDHFTVLWSSPIQIGISLFMLYQKLGWAAFVGLAGMLIMVPLNGLIFYKLVAWEESQLEEKDKRLKLMNDILNGIKMLKLYGWEPAFKEKVLKIRNTELGYLWMVLLMQSAMHFMWILVPYMFMLVSFAVYIFTSEDRYLSADKAFVSIMLFQILQGAVDQLPSIMTELARTRVSLRRLNAFFSRSDIDKTNVEADPAIDEPLSIEDGTFEWDAEIGPSLENITLFVKKGGLTMVVGKVGSGKSSLLSALLGEMHKVSGRVVVNGSKGYVPQEAWIQNDTLRNNILFNTPYQEDFYDSVLTACALKPDIAILAGGEQTEIGERGINLSGGQKQRISLARAVYARANIYLLDDPLSAVDAHVAKQLFEQVISDGGLLGKTTRILVTHNLTWLTRADHIVVMSGGKITDSGTYAELKSRDAVLSLLAHVPTEPTTHGNIEDSHEDLAKAQRLLSMSGKRLDVDDEDSDEHNRTHYGSISKEAEKHKAKQFSGTSLPKIDSMSVKKWKRHLSRSTDDGPAGKLVEEEKVEVGKVEWSIYLDYIRAVGCFRAVVIVFMYALFEAVYLFSTIWIQNWTDDPLLANRSIASNSSEREDRNVYYLGWYGGLGIFQAIFMMAFAMLLAFGTFYASKRLHSALLSNVLRSPMSFFDTTPSGRIINRFSHDTDAVDEHLPEAFIEWFTPVFSILATVVAISYTTPFFLAALLPLAVLYFIVQRFYVRTYRQLQRLQSQSMSPIFSHLTETVRGASVIRAYRRQEEFTAKAQSLANITQHMTLTRYAVVSWLGIVLDSLGALTFLVAALLAVAEHGTITGGLIGMSLSFAMQITELLGSFVSAAADLESDIVAVERIKEYTVHPTEAAWYNPDTAPPSNWPDQGRVELTDYSTRYRPGLDLVLRDISFQTKPSERLAIVGRTGAGKTTITLALFRLLEADSGFITIDGINISKLGLHELRSKLTVLPQDPVLFSGTVRMNLDPDDKQSDVDVWRALEQAHLKEFVQELPMELQQQCGEGGQNLSVGQRQLLCLARSLLRKTKILVLDEATAAVDMETDDIIQQTIRREFKECTVITIAHRLKTIMDYDRVLVLDAGTVAEIDSPQNLLQSIDGHFYNLAREAGIIA